MPSPPRSPINQVEIPPEEQTDDGDALQQIAAALKRIEKHAIAADEKQDQVLQILRSKKQKK